MSYGLSNVTSFLCVPSTLEIFLRWEAGCQGPFFVTLDGGPASGMKMQEEHGTLSDVQVKSLSNQFVLSMKHQ